MDRANWVQEQLLYATYALQVHNRRPEDVDLDALMKADFARFIPVQFVEGDRFYTSFPHLTAYSSNVYTYLLGKVIAVDFFAQFDKKKLLDGPAALRYRKTVLEPGSSKRAADLVHDFLGRPVGGGGVPVDRVVGGDQRRPSRCQIELVQIGP